MRTLGRPVKYSKEIEIGKPVKAFKVKQNGLIMAYEGKSRGQDRIIMIAGHMVGNEFQPVSTAAYKYESYQNLVNAEENVRQYHLQKAFSDVYGPPDQPPPKSDK